MSAWYPTAQKSVRRCQVGSCRVRDQLLQHQARPPTRPTAAPPILLSQILVCATSCAGCRTDRLKAACSMYVMQNTAVVLSALSALVSLQSHQGAVFFCAGAACTIGVGSVSSIGAQGSTLSVEKEWTVVLCNGNSAALAKVKSGSTSALLAPCLSCPIPVHVV
jgi:hypothetical protein